MKYLSKLLLSTFSLFFISCGDNTTTSLLKEVTNITLNENNISIYATDKDINLTATVFYDDGTSSIASGNMAWSTSDTTILSNSTATISASKNSGDAEVIIEYQEIFHDSKSVHIKTLESINYSDINLSITDEEQTVYISGNFENNETNKVMQSNLTWSVNENATLGEVNATAIKLTVNPEATSVILTATLFIYTDNNITFEHTFK